MKVLLLVGGWSTERDISLQSSGAILSAMEQCGHIVTCLDPLIDFEKIIPLAQQHDVAFIHLHGSPGEDGLFQAIFERIGCPYQGSNASGSFLALHKAAAKVFFRKEGIVTPKSIFLPIDPGKDWQHELKYPLFVKPNKGGSSIKISLVYSDEELLQAMCTLFSAGEEVLVEESIKGKEVSCGVLDGQALPPVLIQSRGVFFDYHNKYSLDGAEEICPAPLAESILQDIQNISLRAHNALGLLDYSRSDFILCDDGTLFLLEVNTIPGMTTTSLVPQEAAAIGISFPLLVDRLLHLAVQDFRKTREYE